MEEIIATAGSGTSIPPHPEGQFAATCIDIIDHGLVETTWQGQTRKKHKIAVRFWCGQWDGEGADRRPLWIDAWFTLSLHEKASLRKFLASWRQKPFTEDELRGFNVAKLLHAHALIQVSHNRTPDKTYANIDSVMRLPATMQPPTPLDGYVRVKDRPEEGENGGGFNPTEPEDDGLPF